MEHVTRAELHVWCVFLLWLCLSVHSVHAAADPMASQLIGVKQGVLSERGEPLEGVDTFSSLNAAAMRGALVQILRTTDGNIYPPALNGTPDPRNVVIAQTRIGVGVSPRLINSGRFSTLLAPRPAGGTRIYVRVFNAATLADASFYGDSGVFTVSSLSNQTFYPTIPATSTPLDASDQDGDGLANSLEQSIGTASDAIDSDGDGVADPDEYVAGTDPLHEDSTYPEIVSFQSIGSGLIRIEWYPPVADRRYRIFHASDPADPAMDSSEPMATLVSTGMVNTVIINAQDLSANGTLWFGVSRP